MELIHSSLTAHSRRHHHGLLHSGSRSFGIGLQLPCLLLRGDSVPYPTPFIFALSEAIFFVLPSSIEQAQAARHVSNSTPTGYYLQYPSTMSKLHHIMQIARRAPMFEFEFENPLFEFEHDTPQLDPLFELPPTTRSARTAMLPFFRQPVLGRSQACCRASCQSSYYE